MKIWKYIVSSLLIIGITLLFLLFLDYYKQTGFAGQQETEIYELELMDSESSYTANEIAQMILKGNYQYIDERENSGSDKEILSEAYDNISNMLKDLESDEILKSIKQSLKEENGCKTSTIRNVGYMGEDLITFNLISIYSEYVNMTYEEETGLIITFEYLYTVDEEEKTDETMDDTNSEKVKVVHEELINAVLSYYANVDVNKENVYSEMHFIDEKMYGMSIILMDNKEYDEKIEAEMER